MTMEILAPRRAAADDDEGTTARDGELASLVRQWVRASGGERAQQRTRIDRSFLRLAPAPVEVPDDDTDAADDLFEVGEPQAATTTLHTDTDTDTEAAAPSPRLPHRRPGAQVEQATRIAVLIDGHRVSGEVAAGLVAQLAGRGSVAVCRAYADWRRSDLGPWVERMRREGMHSFHQYAEDDDQALVAMALDAVDIARDASVDEVVLAGDLTSMLPLVHRLHAAGVRVVAVGGAHTPHDVRAACHEFIDTASIDGSLVVPQGRHRA